MFKGGERVRVPNPEAEGTIAATVVVQGEPQRDADREWVRYEEGPQAGMHAKVPHSHIESA
jgi:hypothetical protein